MERQQPQQATTTLHCRKSIEIYISCSQKDDASWQPIMFEHILVRKPRDDSLVVDFGALAEALLFYQSVHLALDNSTLGAIVRSIGLETFISLIDDGYLKATFFRDQLAVATNSHRGLDFHDVGCIDLVGDRDSKGHYDDDKLIHKIIKNTSGADANAASVKKFLERVPLRKLGELHTRPNGITNEARSDLSDPEFLSQCARVVVSKLVPEFSLPDNFSFSAFSTPKGMLISSNLDFTRLNECYHLRVPASVSTITRPLILAHIVDTRASLAIAAEYMGELLTDPLSSDLIELKFNHMLRGRNRSAEQISEFQSLTLDDSKALREAINSGERLFSDFLPILHASRKFKDWLAKGHPDVGLIKEFYRATTANSWLDKLPTKATRFSIFTALGLGVDMIAPTGLGTTAGVAVGAADTFLVDKLLQGWRPHQFVKDTLKPFVSE